MSNLIKVKNISKSFGSFLAVNDISFSLSKGEVLGFLGPNGAGKTTTMRILTGFLKPDTGSVQIKDVDIFNEAKKAKEYLGYVPEGSPLYNEMTTIDFLSFICKVRQVNRVTELPKIIELLDLSDVLLQKIDTLSKGFKRRVGLAQALIHDPEVLILDEPTDGLDPNQKNEVRKLIKKLGKEKAIIISTHILEEVNILCNRTMILSNGKLLIDDKPSNVLKRSKNYNNTLVAVEEISAKDLRSELLGLGKFDNIEIKDNMCLINAKKMSKNFSLTNYLKKQKYTIKHFSINKGDLISNADLLPAMLKTATLGYDGKGQFKLNNLEDCKNISLSIDSEYILEKMVNLKKETSVIVTRFKKNEYEIYEPFENKHEDQILKVSKIPANISKEHFSQSIENAKKISEKLDYVGTLCVEFFIDEKDNLLVNEIAPRVHNSGHMTINSHNISQFENHIRAVCGLKKVNILKLYNAKMTNILGNEITKYKGKKLQGNEFFFDYLKKEVKEKRKMGHFTEINKIND